MSTSALREYRQSTFKLVRSLIVKSVLTAQSVNKDLVYKGFAVNDLDPKSWKYYLNLSGELHDSDSQITVTSLDNLQEIPFTKDSLTNHKATLLEYKMRGNLYDRLIDKYPDMLNYINGVLFPVDIETAINAEDHSILGYDSNHVEEQEVTLMSDLDTYSKAFGFRWNVSDYSVTDELYPAAFIALRTKALTEKIFNLRLRYAKTQEAHSFHYWNYLSGYFGLGDFRGLVDLKQALFLYRNIEFIKHNTHTTQNFDLLVRKFLTERNISFYGYVVKHNTNKLLEDTRPRIEVEKDLLNFEMDVRDADRYQSVHKTLLDGVDTATENNLTIEIDNAEIIERAEVADSNVFMTRTVEADITDTTLLDEISLEELLVSQWIAQAHLGNYRLQVTFTNPTTNSTFRLDAKEAWIVFAYLSAKAYGEDLVNTVTFTDYEAINRNAPGLSDARAMDSNITWDENIINAITAFPRPTVFNSSSAFKEYVEELKVHILRQNLLVYGIEGIYENSAYEWFLSTQYMPYEYTLTQYATYEEFFASKGISFDGISTDDAWNLASDILNEFTSNQGLESKIRFRKELAMLNIVKRLTHRDLQYITNLTEKPTLNVPNKIIRVDPTGSESWESHYYVNTRIEALDVKSERTGSSYGHSYNVRDVARKEHSQTVNLTLDNKMEVNFDVSRGVFAFRTRMDFGVRIYE